MTNPLSASETFERFGFSRLSAIVVDDNVHMRGLMTDILRAFGIGMVYETSDGSEAYNLMKQNYVDVVLCDWVMQDLSGIDLLREIRKEGSEVRNPTVAFIMMTAHSDEWRISQAKDAGVTNFLVKPFSTAALYERLLSIADPDPADARKAAGDDFGSLW